MSHEATIESLRAENARYKEREARFARALRVADGGQYRADWDGAISAVIADRESLRAQLDDMTRQRDEARAACRSLDREVNGPLGLRFGLNERTRELATERERHDYTRRALDEFQGAWASARAAVQSVTNERPDGDVVTFVVESIGRLAIDLDAATSARDALLRALDADSLADALAEIADLRADASRADSERHARKAAERERDTHRQHAIEMEAEADRLRVEYDSDPRTVHLMSVVKRVEGERDAALSRLASIAAVVEPVAEMSEGISGPLVVRAYHDEIDHAHVDFADGREFCRIDGELDDYEGTEADANEADWRLAMLPSLIVAAVNLVPTLRGMVKGDFNE